jgi:hypothetical protein
MVVVFLVSCEALQSQEFSLPCPRSNISSTLHTIQQAPPATINTTKRHHEPTPPERSTAQQHRHRQQDQQEIQTNCLPAKHSSKGPHQPQKRLLSQCHVADSDTFASIRELDSGSWHTRQTLALQSSGPKPWPNSTRERCHLYPNASSLRWLYSVCFEEVLSAILGPSTA